MDYDNKIYQALKSIADSLKQINEKLTYLLPDDMIQCYTRDDK